MAKQTKTRKSEALEIREDVAKLAAHRPHPEHKNNSDESDYGASHFYMMNFSKGLAHSNQTGLVEKPGNFEKFRKAIDGGRVADFNGKFASGQKLPSRKWEAPTAGFVFDLQGPDAQAVTMPPAPKFGTEELAYEMAEVYELALLRDLPFKNFSDQSDKSALDHSIKRLNGTGYKLTNSKPDYDIGHPYTQGYETNRPRKSVKGKLTKQTAFRGSAEGVEHGPYLSQFLLAGNKALQGSGSEADGLIQYGALQIDQRVPVATPGLDYMTCWDEWLLAQNGGIEATPPTLYQQEKRFIATPRDLATYVHHDALYEAYLNACLMMLASKVPFDPNFENLHGGTTDKDEPVKYQAGGFALWGGPHILTLVTEVATRALKAVRWQKFNIHLRLRPEALAARIDKAAVIDKKVGLSGKVSFAAMRDAISDTVTEIEKKSIYGNALLPMAFQEGSPMHPSYGAGHATVAGACVTILKAFFDGTHSLNISGDNACSAYVPSENGHALEQISLTKPLTVNTELNKLAANISIGRNMAGVHYYSDYYDSLRMGEAVAIGLLEEQAIGYQKDDFEMSLETFDGKTVTINRTSLRDRLGK